MKSDEAVPRELARAVVAIAASAGGLDAVSTVLAGMPETMAAAVMVVQHLDPNHRSLMAEILDRRTALTVKSAEDGEALLAGVVYVAPPDHHLVVGEDRCAHLTQSQRIHFLRPSADLLFATAARVYGPATVALVLTGTGSDGTDGAGDVRRQGGRVFVEDPETAAFGSMPAAAVRAGVVDEVLAIDSLAPAIVEYLALRDGD